MLGAIGASLLGGNNSPLRIARWSGGLGIAGAVFGYGIGYGSSLALNFFVQRKAAVLMKQEENEKASLSKK